MHDVICLGSAAMDVFVETEKSSATTQYAEGRAEKYIAYRSGEKILVTNLHFETGGGGTNTAVCLARLGLQTAYVGNIGDDLNGKSILEKLKHEGVDFLGTKSEDLTNYSIILDSTLLQDRTILVYKGASERLLFQKLPALASKWIYISSLSGESFRTAKRLIEKMRPEGTKVAFNPSNYQIEHNKDEVLQVISNSEVAVMNREEAALLVGDGHEEEMLVRIRNLGPSVAIITMGNQGITASDGKHIYRASPRSNIPVRETTGAGDCFASTFVAATIIGKDMEEALRWALVNVENHIQHIGAKSGLLTRSEINYVLVNDNRAILISPVKQQP
jgi:ribokinase